VYDTVAGRGEVDAWNRPRRGRHSRNERYRARFFGKKDSPLIACRPDDRGVATVADTPRRRRLAIL